MEDHSLFQCKMGLGSQDVILSSNKIFHPTSVDETNPAIQLAMSLEDLIDIAPEFTPKMEKTLDKSTENVRSFIKSAAGYFGKINLTLESV